MVIYLKTYAAGKGKCFSNNSARLNEMHFPFFADLRFIQIKYLMCNNCLFFIFCKGQDCALRQNHSLPLRLLPKLEGLGCLELFNLRARPRVRGISNPQPARVFYVVLCRGGKMHFFTWVCFDAQKFTFKYIFVLACILCISKCQQLCTNVADSRLLITPSNGSNGRIRRHIFSITIRLEG